MRKRKAWVPLRHSEKKAVFDAIVKGRGKGSRLVNSLLNPAETRPYPSFMLGSRSKVPRESYYGWTLVPKIRKAFGKEYVPGSVIKEALYKRSAIEYGKEWATDTKKPKKEAAKKAMATKRQMGPQTTRERMVQWKEDIQKNVRLANFTNSKRIAPELQRKIDAGERTGRKPILVDLGSGDGKTTLPIVKELSQDQRKHVLIVLVDVSVKDLRTARKELIKEGISAENIKMAKVNFGSMEKSSIIRNLAGKADIVTSGAALHHLSKSETVFREVNKLLKKNGSFKFWDWCHPAWRAPKLVVAPKGANVSINGRACSYKGKIYKAERGTAFISQEQYSGRGTFKPPSELAQTREMLSTWVSLLNFPQSERAKFDKYFDRQVAAGKPIHFEAYLRRLEKTMPSSPVKMQIMEGHKLYRLYERALMGSGMALGGKTRFYTDSTLLAHFNVKKR